MAPNRTTEFYLETHLGLNSFGSTTFLWLWEIFFAAFYHVNVPTEWFSSEFPCEYTLTAQAIAVPQNTLSHRMGLKSFLGITKHVNWLLESFPFCINFSRWAYVSKYTLLFQPLVVWRHFPTDIILIDIHLELFPHRNFNDIFSAAHTCHTLFLNGRKSVVLCLSRYQPSYHLCIGLKSFSYIVRYFNRDLFLPVE